MESMTSERRSLQNDDIGPKLVLVGCLELNLAIISGCLPSLRSSFVKVASYFRRDNKPSSTSSHVKSEPTPKDKSPVGALDNHCVSATGKNGGSLAEPGLQSSVIEYEELFDQKENEERSQHGVPLASQLTTVSAKWTNDGVENHAIQREAEKETTRDTD
jgi:hypothetical protein